MPVWKKQNFKILLKRLESDVVLENTLKFTCNIINITSNLHWILIVNSLKMHANMYTQILGAELFIINKM